MKRFLTIILTMMFTFVYANCPIINTEINFTKNSIIEKQESIKIKLVKDVDNKVNNKNISTHIVEAALSNNIDICFMLAQSLTETNYGTTGIGKSKYSLFGVSSRYTSYEDAIYDYCRILNTHYLVNGKTEQHLLVKYVNKHGKRYASNRNYESTLRTNYKDLVRSTKIAKLQNEYFKTINS